MVALMMITTVVLTKSMNPISMAVMILIVSLLATQKIYKELASSWLPFVVIITFSTGMMTLFMYTTSLSSNEKMKNKKKPMVLMTLLVTMITMPHMNTMKNSTTMKMFSSQLVMMTMMTLLILTMLTVSNHGHHPNQTMTTSF